MTRQACVSAGQTGSQIRGSPTPGCESTTTGPSPPESSAHTLSVPTGTMVSMPATLGPPPPPGHGNKTAPARRHECPGAEPELARELAQSVLAEPWLASAVDAGAASGLPYAWIGAGAIRDVVWGQLHDGFDPALVRDVDVVFFDPGDLSRARDEAAQRRLGERAGRPRGGRGGRPAGGGPHRGGRAPRVPGFFRRPAGAAVRQRPRGRGHLAGDRH